MVIFWDTYSLTRLTLASTVFCAMFPSLSVSFVVWKNCWCHAAGLPSGMTIWLAKIWAINCRRSCNRCNATCPAVFSCCGVKGGISTCGGGGARRTPFVDWFGVLGAVKQCFLVAALTVATWTYVVGVSFSDNTPQFRLHSKDTAVYVTREHLRKM